MDYQLQIRKFLTSQYLYTGVRITAGVLIPAFVLYNYGLLISMISIPLGALFISLTDSPGPISERRNGMLLGIVICFVVLIISGYSKGNWMLILPEIIVFGFTFSIIGVFGNRATSIGIVALLVFILNIDFSNDSNVLRQALFFVAGGAWYAVLSLALYNIRPYRPIEQLLGECLMEIADYLQTKRLMYEKERNFSEIFKQLMQYQVKIHNHQNDLRNLLFTTRRYFSESTARGRVLMMMFLDSIDLQESIMTSQQDYELLHKEFDETGVLEQINGNIRILANELHHIGLAVQSGYAYKSTADLDAAFQQSFDAFAALRKKELNSSNLEKFIRLRHILYSLQDITDRIKRIANYTTFDSKTTKELKRDIDLERFEPPPKISLQLLLSNISFKSSNFRHAVRVTFALLIGFAVSLFFPLGHSYWILLTIAVIMKPAYGITRERNIHRLVGTFIGAAIGFAILFFLESNTVIFISMIISMIIAYSMLKLNYGVSSAAITIYVLLNFHFLNPGGMQNALTDRVVDTVIGSVIAYLVSYFVLPAWEHEQIDNLIGEAIDKNKKYFENVAKAFIGIPTVATDYKQARKDAFVALANLSDTFQKMLSEPKSQQGHLQEYHQFVAASHMLTSHIASLSYYARRSAPKYVQEEFQPVIKEVENKFTQLKNIQEKNQPAKSTVLQLPMNKKVLQLLSQRKQELESGIDDPNSVRKKLSDLKTITDQFQLIHSNLNDQAKILQTIKGIKPLSLQTVAQN